MATATRLTPSSLPTAASPRPTAPASPPRSITSLATTPIKVGFWYERAQHKQTGPAVAVDANGNPVDQWLRDGRILRPDGSEFNSRNWLTISPAYQAYFSDQFSFMNDRGLLRLACARAQHHAQVHQLPEMKAAAPSTSTAYTVEKKFNDVLPQIGPLQS